MTSRLLQRALHVTHASSVDIINKKCALALLMAIASSLNIFAAEYTTPDDGTAYTLAALAEIPESGVCTQGDGVYTLTNDVTITAANSFSITGVKSLLLADDVTFTINCQADFNAPDTRVLVTRASETDAPRGIVMACDILTDEEIAFRNIDFEYAALKGAGLKGFTVDDCSFTLANGRLTGTAALTVGSSGASFEIRNCKFTDCTVPAIGGAANYACGLQITGCTFTNNNTSNTNKPQLNLTVGGDLPIVITDCTLTGAGLNMVGGIAVANLLNLAGANHVEIRGCTITDHRYGITGIGMMDMVIADNTLISNKYETNPMNGGSGISLAGYGYGLDAIISGNHIEDSLWGVTLIMCRNVSLGEIDNPDSPGNNVFKDNGNGGVAYDLYNNQAAPVYAQNNTWSVSEQTAELIETVIYHNADDPSLGEVIFLPAHDAGFAPSSILSNIITLASDRLLSSDPITIYSATGVEIIPSSFNPSITSLSPGIYIARTPTHSLKFLKVKGIE